MVYLLVLIVLVFVGWWLVDLPVWAAGLIGVVAMLPVAVLDLRASRSKRGTH